MTIGTLIAHIGLNTKPLEQGVTKSHGLFRSLGRQIDGVGSALGGFSAQVTGATAALAGLLIFKKITEVGSKFTHELTVAGAVMEATTEQIALMRAEAFKLGESTEFGAIKAAEAFKQLGQSGFDAAKSVQAMPHIFNLATAAQFSLEESARLAAAAMHSFGLETRDMGRIADVFVGAVNRSATDMADLGEAFKYASPVAASFGYTIEETAGLLGVLGNAGLRGSLAGTNLAQAFTKATLAASKLGLESTDLVDVLVELNSRGASPNDFLKLFGRQGGRVAFVLAQLTKESREFQNALRDVGGEAKTLSDIMRGTTETAFKQLMATVENTAIQAFEQFEAELAGEIRALTKWVQENRSLINQFVQGLATIIVGVSKLVGLLVVLLAAMSQAFAEAFGGIETRSDRVVGAMRRLVDDGFIGPMTEAEMAMEATAGKMIVALAPPDPTPWEEFWALLGILGTNLFEVVEATIKTIGNVIAGVLKVVFIHLGHIAGAIGDVWNALNSLIQLDFSGVGKSLKSLVQHATDAWRQGAKASEDAVNGIVDAWTDGVKDMDTRSPGQAILDDFVRAQTGANKLKGTVEELLGGDYSKVQIPGIFDELGDEEGGGVTAAKKSLQAQVDGYKAVLASGLGTTAQLQSVWTALHESERREIDETVDAFLKAGGTMEEAELLRAAKSQGEFTGPEYDPEALARAKAVQLDGFQAILEAGVGTVEQIQMAWDGYHRIRKEQLDREVADFMQAGGSMEAAAALRESKSFIGPIFDPEAAQASADATKATQMAGFQAILDGGVATTVQLQAAWDAYEMRRQKQIYAEVDAYLDAGASIESAQALGLTRTKQLLAEEREFYAEHGTLLQQWADEFQGSLRELLGSALTSAITGDWESMADTISDIWNNLMTELAEQTAKDFVASLMSKEGGGGDGGGGGDAEGAMSFISKLFSDDGGGGGGGGGGGSAPVDYEAIMESAHGAAEGGMFRKPTFAMLGEAGPEAVIPLEKLKDPDFMRGMGGHGRKTAVQVTMNIQTPDIGSFRASAGQIAGKLGVAIDQVSRRNN